MLPSRSIALNPRLRKVADPHSLEPNRGKVVIMDDHPIALFSIDGKYFAMDNTCPHRGGSLGEGDVSGGIVTCPWHGWQFNCRTGEAVENRAIRVKTYDLSVKGDCMYVAWPHG